MCIRDRDEIVEIMLETVCTARKTIRIAGADYPAELVTSKFMKLNSSHVAFVLDCMRANTTTIRNIKQYLKAVLFNAPSTIDSYYTAPVSYTHLDVYKRQVLTILRFGQRSFGVHTALEFISFLPQ